VTAIVHFTPLPFPGCQAIGPDHVTTPRIEDCTCVACLRQLISNEQNAHVDVRKIASQGVKIYALFWKAFALGLRADKRFAAAKKMAALSVATEREMRAADELLRDTFKYDRARPNETAPAGFYPLLGMRLALVHLQGTLVEIGGFDGTFAGYFNEFCKSVAKFDDEVGEKIHRSAPTLAEEASKILHEVPPLPHYQADRIHAYKKQRDTNNYPEAFYVQVGGCSVRTWQFGSVHQCVINIDDSASVGLLACDSATSALEHGIVWAEAFEKDGVPSIDKLFTDCFQHWPTLYRTRVDVINHVLFTIGGGYTWCRGGILCGDPEDHLGERQHRRHREKDPAPGPEPDDGGPRDFYPVSDGSSNICRVPDNVTDAWLHLAYEAATMLRDRSQALSHKFLGMVREPAQDEIDRQQKNREVGAIIVADLKKRFGDRTP
jgi:hypothetical protein